MQGHPQSRFAQPGPAIFYEDPTFMSRQASKLGTQQSHGDEPCGSVAQAQHSAPATLWPGELGAEGSNKLEQMEQCGNSDRLKPAVSGHAILSAATFESDDTRTDERPHNNLSSLLINNGIDPQAFCWQRALMRRCSL